MKITENAKMYPNPFRSKSKIEEQEQVMGITVSLNEVQSQQKSRGTMALNSQMGSSAHNNYSTDRKQNKSFDIAEELIRQSLKKRGSPHLSSNIHSN